MKYEQLLELIRQDESLGKRKIVALQKEYGIKNRQDVYKYIRYYVNDERGKIPDRLCRYFNEITSDPSSEKKELKINSLEEYRYAIQTLDYEIELVKEDLERMGEEDPSFLDYLKELQTKRDYLAEKYESKKKEDREKRIAKISKDGYEFEPVDDMLRKALEAGGYGGPRWNTTNCNVSTICIADDGDYMVIERDGPNDKRSKELYVYAVIQGSRHLIAIYPFKPGESFVRFSLIPKLSYFYEVKYNTDDEWTSGVLELKNFA